MILISFASTSLILGAKAIFTGLTWEIQEGQKIGLIGPNGVGKTSLFRMINGEYQPEPGGAINLARGVRIGYLPQQLEFDPALSAFSVAMQGNPRWAELNDELSGIEASLNDPAVYGDEKRLTRILERHQTCLEQYASLGGEQYPGMVRGLLCDLGLEDNQLEQPLGQLSGGQKKLVGLARAILARPAVLLLDEPDNHLDIPGKIALERLIRDYSGTVVIISHDRYLLDACVSQIAELEDGQITTFAGDYTSYMLEKEERLARQQQLYQVQLREILRIQAAIKRYAIWAKIYDNEAFAKRARSIQRRLARMECIDRPVLERRRMDLALEGWRGSTQVLEFAGVSKAYESLRVLTGVNILLRHGDRVGLVGPNGSGKSVILRLAMGEEQPDSGEMTVGPSVRLGYYAQEHETLNFDQTLIDVVRYAGSMSEANTVAFLKRYLFTYQQAGQKVYELSGGERSRLQLALLVLSGANCLLLDEPTNNLDIPSAEVLEEALDDFDGTVLVVSHDRYFLDRVVTRILVIEPQGKVKSIEGNYSDAILNRQEQH